MKLSKVEKGRYMAFQCYRCGDRFNTYETADRDRVEVTADLDGPPWQAYYCPDCTAQLGQPIEATA